MPLKYYEDREIRESHYKRYLGRMGQLILLPADVNEKPHIDVYQFPPTPQKPYWTLITSGMSDAKQNVPHYYKMFSSGRTELLIYVKEPQAWMFGFLKDLALMPFRNKTLLHWDDLHCLSSCPLTESSDFTHLLFLSPLWENYSFRKDFQIAGEKTDFLWAVPITKLEHQQCLQNDFPSVMKNIMGNEPAQVFV